MLILEDVVVVRFIMGTSVHFIGRQSVCADDIAEALNCCDTLLGINTAGGQEVICDIVAAVRSTNCETRSDSTEATPPKLRRWCDLRRSSISLRSLRSRRKRPLSRYADR